MKLKYVYILVILLILAVGCTKPPEEEMKNAREAVFIAENDPDAALYARSLLARARESLSAMEVEAGNKRYDAVKAHAADAISAAERARLEGSVGAARAREEAASLVSGLRSEIEEALRNVNGAMYSQLSLDFDDLYGDIRNVNDAADRAESSRLDGRYQDAIDIARDIRVGLSDINGRVASAATTAKK
ncbi:MAG: hypothetical protein LBC80_07930 [Treponema sp.]|jgi:hypothetical protein|nr:hypothetical protein [Treponema sp.]